MKTFEIAQAVEDLVFLGPPHGHAGCYAVVTESDLQGVRSSDIIRLRSPNYDKIVSVLDIEKPGICRRFDMFEFLNWYKIHWVNCE